MAIRCITTVLAVILMQGAWAMTYRVTEMPGNIGDRSPAINRWGEVAGTQVELNNDIRAYVWSDGQLTLLGTLGGTTIARGINRHGEVVGLSYVDARTFHAYFWSDGHLQDIGTLGGSNSVATGINRHRRISGYSRRADGRTHAFVYHQGLMTDLGTLGGRDSSASAINTAGHVVGRSQREAGWDHAFLHDGSSMRDLGALPAEGWSSANDVNDGGEAVGASGSSSYGPYRATLFKDGQVIDLGTLGGTYSHALAINNRGHIVGWSTGSAAGLGFNDDKTKAFLYRDGRMISLNHRLDPVTGAGWRLRAATGINERGDIVGWGHRGTAARLFLLTPMDEP
jgi:probable HAF family extracellular repeat protein